MDREVAKLEAIRCVKKYNELGKWLEQCPAYDAQPFYETAGELLQALLEEGHEALLELGEEILADRFCKIRDGENVDGTDPNWEQKALDELARDIEIV